MQYEQRFRGLRLRLGVAIAIAATLFLMPAAAFAQTGKATGGAAAPLPPARGAPAEGADAAPQRLPPPGYEVDLMRLSEVMGALSLLRTLCGAQDAPLWHDRMAALIDSEARDAETRSRLAGAFNQGYSGFSITYRACTPAAQTAIARYLDEGERLSRAIASRFGG